VSVVEQIENFLTNTEELCGPDRVYLGRTEFQELCLRHHDDPRFEYAPTGGRSRICGLYIYLVFDENHFEFGF